MATNVTTYSCTCCGGCSNQCVVEFETNFYDCSGWTTPTATGPADCSSDIDLMWVEDPADCLRYTRFVATSPPKCCTNTANCATSTASAPPGLGVFIPPCAPPSFSCDTDCCATYVVSVVGGCYAGTYDCVYIGSCQWVDSTNAVYLRCTGIEVTPGVSTWEVIVDGHTIPACAGLDQQICSLRLEQSRGCCACPPVGGSYTLDTSLNDPPLPYDCGAVSVTVTGVACP